MATVPSSSSTPLLSSASNSKNFPTQPTFNSTSPKPQVDNNVEDTRPDQLPCPIDDLYTASYKEKFKKYETDFICLLMSNYFSKKNVYGENIFNESITIECEIIKSSRWLCTRSNADPAQGFEDQSIDSLTTTTYKTKVPSGRTNDIINMEEEVMALPEDLAVVVVDSPPKRAWTSEPRWPCTQ